MPIIPINSPSTKAAASPPSNADTGVTKSNNRARKKLKLKIHKLSILSDFDHVIQSHMIQFIDTTFLFSIIHNHNTSEQVYFTTAPVNLFLQQLENDFFPTQNNYYKLLYLLLIQWTLAYHS